MSPPIPVPGWLQFSDLNGFLDSHFKILGFNTQNLSLIQWDTLNHCADCVVSDPLECDSAKRHLVKVLRLNGYSKNLLTTTKKDTRDKTSSPKDVTQPELRKKPPVVTPYVKGVSEHIRRVMSKFKVQVFFKPVNTLRQLLVRPKDPLDKEWLDQCIRSSVVTVMLNMWGKQRDLYRRGS